jgi:hypothetical protein
VGKCSARIVAKHVIEKMGLRLSGAGGVSSIVRDAAI